MDEKLRKIKRQLFWMCVIYVTMFFIIITGDSDISKAQYLNSIDYQVTLNKDGSMNVVETWDINVYNTNTLFKTFNLNTSKYSGITDVKVKDITKWKNTDLKQINKYMYHVTKDCYYGLNTNGSEFEIAWGIGVDQGYENRKYQISYLVKDVVTNYSDCQEMYWSFLGKGANDIPAKKVTGTVILPENVSNIENLRIWGHGQLNGEIKKINEKQTRFNLTNLQKGSMLEIRVVTEDKMFNVSTQKTRPYNNLSNIINEETTWANEANEDAEFSKKIRNILIVIYIGVVITYIRKIKKCQRISNEETIIPKKIKYYRDIPRENDSTPAEAAYLYEFNKQRLDTEIVQREAVSATILDLCLKKKISLRADDLGDIYIKIIDKPDGLKDDELSIYKLLEKVERKQEFNIKELEDYAYKNYYEYSASINKLVNKARENLYKLGLIDKYKEKLYSKSLNAGTAYTIIKNVYMWLILNHFIMLIPFFKIRIVAIFGIAFQYTVGWILALIFPLICVILYSLKLQKNLNNKIAVLTQKGSEEQEQWKGLAEYMKEFSMLNERKVPELVIWEKYLVYATALGIAEKVIEQMKATYPEVFVQEQWEDEAFAGKYPVIHFVITPSYRVDNIIRYNSINRMCGGVSKAYYTARAEISTYSSSTSSGSGGRRRLLGRRRRPVVVGGRNGRQIIISKR